MLTEKELLTLDKIPDINEVSLKLYKDFSKHVLMQRKFKYILSDGTVINVQFKEEGIHHMLGIHHIDKKINKFKFFQAIEDGLTLDDFKKSSNKKIKLGFKDMSKRICAFACVYNMLITGNIFYIPDNIISGTTIEVSYLLYGYYEGSKNEYGINIGLRDKLTYYMPLTILCSKPDKREKYINKDNFRIVDKLFIYDTNDNLLEEYSHAIQLTSNT